MVEFRVLGPLEVVKDGVTVPLRRPRLRALLALLLLHANEVVSSERIIDALWGDDPPQNAANAVQTTVSRLRKELVDGDDAVAEMIRTRPPGYVIQLAPDALDLARFERLVEQGRAALHAGRPETASQHLRDALATWHGPALADVQYEGLLQRERERLDEERLTTLELRIDADLACGRHMALVGELEALVAENPYRERLRSQLMLALYRSGRQAEALAAYQEARRLLVDELGIEPSRALQELERSILRQDPSLEELAPDAIERRPRSLTTGAAPSPSVPTARRTGRRRWLLAGLLALPILVVAAWAATIPFGGSDSPPGLSRLAPNAVGFIDPETNRLIGQVPVGQRPISLAVDDDAVWVLNADDRTISRVDVDGRRIATTFGLSGTGEPAGLAAAEGAVWLGRGLYGPLSLARISPSFNRIAETMRLGRAEEPFFAQRWQVAVGAGSIWTVGPRFGTVLRIDPLAMRIVSPIDVGIQPATLSVGEGAVWAGGSRNVVKRINPRTNEVDGEWEELPQGPLAIATGAGAVWVTAAGEDVVARIDPATDAVTTHEVGDLPTAVAVGHGSVWVANAGDGTVSRIDPETREIEATIRLGASPEAVAVADRVVLVATSAALETH